MMLENLQSISSALKQHVYNCWDAISHRQITTGSINAKTCKEHTDSSKVILYWVFIIHKWHLFKVLSLSRINSCVQIWLQNRHAVPPTGKKKSLMRWSLQCLFLLNSNKIGSLESILLELQRCQQYLNLCQEICPIFFYLDNLILEFFPSIHTDSLLVSVSHKNET